MRMRESWKALMAAYALFPGCDSRREPGVDHGAMALIAVGEGAVEGFELTITPVPCPADVAPPGHDPNAEPPVVNVEVTLEAFELPTAFGNRPLAEDTVHHFDDYFQSLDPGCYDIVAIPLVAGGEASQDCSMATVESVVVYEETTTEIVLVSQCQSVGRGALDAVLTLNHEPRVTVDLDKFGHDCESTRVCATAVDQDDDPLAFSWEVPAGLHAWFYDPQQDAPTPGRGSDEVLDIRDTIVRDGDAFRSCIEIAGTEEAAHQVSVRVYDYHYLDFVDGDDDDPPQIRYYTANDPPEATIRERALLRAPNSLEDYCTRQDPGNPGCESHAELLVPYFVSDESPLVGGVPQECMLARADGHTAPPGQPYFELWTLSDGLGDEALVTIMSFEQGLLAAADALGLIEQNMLVSAREAALRARDAMESDTIDRLMEAYAANPAIAEHYDLGAFNHDLGRARERIAEVATVLEGEPAPDDLVLASQGLNDFVALVQGLFMFNDRLLGDPPLEP